MTQKKHDSGKRSYHALQLYPRATPLPSFIRSIFIVRTNKMLITTIIINYYRLLSINTYYYGVWFGVVVKALAY